MSPCLLRGVAATLATGAIAMTVPDEILGRGHPGDVGGDIRGDIGAHRQPVHRSSIETDLPQRPASPQLVVTADGSASLNETSALVLAEIIRARLDAGDRKRRSGQDSAA